MIKVAKFGGTSMADAVAMRRCASIIASDRDKRVIVVSATSGTTNLLTDLIQTNDREVRLDRLEQIRQKHEAILVQLEEPESVRTEIDQLLQELTELSSTDGEMSLDTADQILSVGERLSSTLFTQVLREEGMNAEFFDARQVMITDDQFSQAEPDLKVLRIKSEEKLLPGLRTKRFVTQGFIGSTVTGKTTTLGRGGSDYSAALIAEAVDADVLEIWTDVTAVYTTDPRLVPDARPITEVTFNEAAELSVFGAKVLHPATLKPAIRKNIRVYVGSSIHPEQPGTWIVKETREYPVIRAISLRREQTLVTVHSLEMLHRHGFLAKLFQILADFKVSVDLVTTSEVSVSLTLDTNVQGKNRRSLSPELLSELQKIADVTIETDLALVALVGNKLDATSGISGPIFGALHDVNIRMICHGASSHNLCFLVREADAVQVVQKLHDTFISVNV